MSLQKNECQAIFSYLRSLNFHFLDLWVIECVNYYKSVNPSISFDVLKNEVRQQWLLVNLREINVPCLPPDLKSKKKIILSGNYAVQVESMIDSSVSCYSQFQNLLKMDTSDAELTTEPKEWNPQSKRCLTFVICDGVQEIQAMEYQPIKKIKPNDAALLPGFKMIIMGPVECRKGMILLKDENVRICGGEVDTLAVTNSLKNLLIKKLDLDETEYLDTPSQATQEKGNLQIPAEQNQNYLEDESVECLLSQNEDFFLNLQLESEGLEQNPHPSRSLNANQEALHNNDSMIICIKEASNSKKHSLPLEDLEMPSEKRLSLDIRQESDQALCSSAQNSLQDDFNSNIFLDDFEKIPIIIPETKKPVQTNLSQFFNKTSNVNMISNVKLVSISSKPFVYLKHIMSSQISKPTIFTIKAIILTLRKKITIENDKFNLKANITDSSSATDVEFCSELLEEILGYSPCEMTELLKIRQTNTAIAQMIKESFSKAQEKLIFLNCLMEIKFFNDGKTPIVLSLEEIAEEHLQALKERSWTEK